MTDANSFSEPISVAKLRRDLAEVLGRAHYNNITTPVENHGKPFAAVISDDDARLLAFVKDAADAPIGSILRCAADTLLSQFKETGGLAEPEHADPSRRAPSIGQWFGRTPWPQRNS
jgi:hypothetical protein